MLPLSYTVRNLARQPARTVQTIVGSALVVLLITGAAAFNLGMTNLLKTSGSPKNVMLLSAGSEESVERSEVQAQVEGLAITIPGIAEHLGEPAVSAEVRHMAPLASPQHPELEARQAVLRGVTERALLVHTALRITEGTFPRSGEIMVGRYAHRRVGLPEEALAVGKEVLIGEQPYVISARFSASGTVLESEFWMDRNDLLALSLRENLSCVVIRLEEPDPGDVELFALQRNDLELVAITEDRYYARLAAFYGPIRSMTWLTAALVAGGAVFGGLNTLYAAFASRIRELATLQAIGFGKIALFVSLLQESVLACLAGTLIALTLGPLLLDGRAISFSSGVFHLQYTPSVLITGLICGASLGIIGTLPPAWHCLSPKLPSALRSS